MLKAVVSRIAVLAIFAVIANVLPRVEGDVNRALIVAVLAFVIIITMIFVNLFSPRSGR